MTTAALTASQLGYVNKAYWRNPTRAFFTFAFPLMFLVIFTALLGNGTVHIGPLSVRLSTYYVATMACFGVIMACYSNMAVSIAYQRDAGILKRLDGSPLPRSAFMISRVLHSLFVAVLLVVITAAFGRLFYHAQIPGGMAFTRSAVTLVVGSGAFCALGLAVTAAIPNFDAAMPIVNASILPLLFLSGIFIPFGNGTPAWIEWVARIFPVRHFTKAMMAGFVGTPFSWSDVAVVAAWGVGGLLIAVRYFAWEERD